MEGLGRGPRTCQQSDSDAGDPACAASACPSPPVTGLDLWPPSHTTQQSFQRQTPFFCSPLVSDGIQILSPACSPQPPDPGPPAHWPHCPKPPTRSGYLVPTPHHTVANPHAFAHAVLSSGKAFHSLQPSKLSSRVTPPLEGSRSDTPPL